jgi:hypothetical protein
MPSTPLHAAPTLRRWFRSLPLNSSALTTNSAVTTRLEVRPPSLREAPDQPWQRLMFWLLAPSPGRVSPGPGRLGTVRADFHACVADLTSVPDAGHLVHRIEMARSLRELWHLRPDVYRLVAVEHSQAEAEARVASLNRHFPTRSPRSGFVPL